MNFFHRRSWIRQPSRRSPFVSSVGVDPLPVSSAPSTSTSCQAEYKILQNDHTSTLANAYDAVVVPPFLLSPSAGAQSGDGRVDCQQNNAGRGPYLQAAAESDMIDSQGALRPTDGKSDSMEGIVYTETNPSSHSSCNIDKQDETLLRPPRPQSPLPASRILRSRRSTVPLTKQTATPKKAVIHEASLSSETDIVQVERPDLDVNTDRDPSCTVGQQGPVDYVDAREAKQSLKAELIKAMKIEAGESNDDTLTENLEAIIDRFVKPELETEMTAMTEDRIAEDIKATTKRPLLKCPGCAKYKQSPSELK